MEPDAARRGMRVLCPIHSPDPAPPTSEPVGVSETAESPEPQLRRGCQGNQVFDTAIAKDLAGCAFAAYHQVSGDPAVSLRVHAIQDVRLCTTALSTHSHLDDFVCFIARKRTAKAARSLAQCF